MDVFAKDTKRGHINERIRTSFYSQGSRVAGDGILRDNYSENSCPSVITDTNYFPDREVDYPLTKEEKEFRDNGGPVTTYKLNKED